MGCNIFISYRRDDSAGHAGHLFDMLRKRFGKRVFIDISSIQSGDDFDETIERALGDCGAFVVVIGRQWMSVSGPDGNRRLDDPRDYVHRELATALRKNVPVVPVLVQGAAPPRPSDLPDDLKQLGKIHAHEITDSRWDYDAGLLVRRLERVLRSVRVLPWVVAVAAAVAIFISAYKWLPIRTGTMPGTYSADVWSWDSADGWLELPIVLDGVSTGFRTPHTFVGLTGDHVFTMPCTNSQGRSFSDWSNNWKDVALTVKAAGKYTARYRDSYSATVWSWDSVKGWLQMPITMDGTQTAYQTPYTFAGLAGSHTFTVPGVNSLGRRFSDWSNGWSEARITVKCAGIYTARYRE